MADDDKQQDAQDAQQSPATDGTEALGDPGKKALDRMKAERDEARRQAKALADVEKKLREYEDRDKTEAQKLAERAEAAERELAQTRLSALRARVALTKGLPAALADRLVGEDEDAMGEDADRLLALVSPAAPGRPRGDIDQGARTGGNGIDAGAKPDMNALIRAAARGGDPL